LQLASHNEIQSWRRLFDITTKRDHAQLLEIFTEMRFSHKSDIGSLDQTDLVRNIMALLQNVRTIYNVPNHIGIDYSYQSLGDNYDDETRKGVKAQLYHLQKQTGELLPELQLDKGEVIRLGNFPVSGNMRMDIWEGLVSFCRIV